MSLFFDAQGPVLVPIAAIDALHNDAVFLAQNHWPWAHLSPTPIDSGLAIPPQWRTTYPHIFASAQGSDSPLVSLIPTDLIALNEVVITALSSDAYQIASAQESTLEDWFSKESTILRQGNIYTFTHLPINGYDSSASSLTCSYRIDMLEPVLQGIARKGSTRLILINSDTDGLLSPPLDDTLSETDSENIEIGEAFLASSTLSSVLAAPHTDNSASDPQELLFRTTPLSQDFDTLGDHCTIYTRTADLSKIGVQNGDWALARPSCTSSCRLVRILANDERVPAVGTVAASPILLRNLLPEDPTSQSMICIWSSPFGSRKPPVPTARTLTIARVASPLSVNRIYEPLLLETLKTYLDHTKRLVKQRDIIALPIDTGDIALRRNNVVEDKTIDDAPKPSAFASRSNEVVFFCITNIEHDIVKHDASLDVYNGTTIGELGCWVDSSVTRVVQAGVEHSWVPDVGTYFEADPSSPRALYSTLSRQGSSHALGPDSPYDNLLHFMSATSAQKAMDYKLDLSVLLKGARGIVLDFPLPSIHLSSFTPQISCYDIIGENDAQTEGTLRARFDVAKECSPCVLLLRHVEALAQTTQALEPGKEPAIAKALHECILSAQEEWKITGYPVVILGTTSQPGQVPPNVLSLFKHEISFEAPGEKERYEILETSLSADILAADVSLSSLAIQTAAFVASDLVDLVARARYASMDRAIRSGARPPQLVHAGVALTAEDFEIALNKSRASYSENIGAPKIPNVTWDDVGGLAHVKSDILDTIQLPLEHPELFADGLKKRSGILLYGPPGTGKTLVAKAVATSCSLNFFSVKGPELLNMYIGESEANVRRVFQRARDAKPCVIFFDELDSVAPKRGNQGDSGGVMDRIVSQLLAELDGMSGEGGADVFVIGATNRPDLLDPALLRPGRFDRMLYLGVSETHEAQQNILEALTRKFRLAPDLDLRQVAEQCPFNYTGADFYALCSDAMLNAMSRKAKDVDDKIARLNSVPGPYDYPTPLTPQYFLAEMASEDDINVLVSREDFERALKDLVPSVSQSEMDHYLQVQRRFSKDKLQL
ncbi:hypothetical protein H0H92_013954 [Tricholoma furcatifolium]|nr:hypothetical protein H0H92_013954 [Tricholoma furcatifolium]